MTDLTQPDRVNEPPSYRWKIIGDLVAALALVTVTAVITSWLLEFPPRYLINTVGYYLVVATLLLVTTPNTLTGPGLGHANRITLLRACLIVHIAAIVTRPVPLTTSGLWWVITVSSIALVLDGIDGRVSRSKQCETAFGARFDMELDAFFLLVLSVLGWKSGKAGLWITGIGMIRYGFVIAASFTPWLGKTLPESLRRKTVCAVQGIALLICLGPIISSALATLIGAVALGSLVVSFAIGIQWLASHRKTLRSTE